MNRIAAAVGLVVATSATGQEARVLQVPIHPVYGQLIPRTISGDGRVVVGYGLATGRATPMVWTVDGQIEVCLSSVFANASASGSVCSYDGTIVAGTTATAGQIGFRWVRGGAVTLLRGLAGQLSLHSAVAISADGSIIGGDVYLGAGHSPGWSAGYWTASGGTVNIPGIAGGAASRTISAMSRDGRTMVGNLFGGAPFIWRADAGSFAVPLPGPTYVTTDGLSLTGNGDAIFGNAVTIAPILGTPFTWNPDTGSTIIPGAEGHEKTSIRCASADGRVAAGSSHEHATAPYGDSGAVIYTLGTGTQFLADVLRDFGVSQARADFGSCFDMSADGMTLLGKDGLYPYWVVVLPEPEPADYNVDRRVDFRDIEDFVDCFTGNSSLPVSSADIDGDGAVDFFDYDEFVARFH